MAGMSSQPFSLLWVGPGAPPCGLPAAVAAVASGRRRQRAPARRRAGACARCRPALESWARQADLAQAAFEVAVLVLTPVQDEALEHELLQRGVQAILPADDAAACGAPRATPWRASRPNGPCTMPTPPIWPPACRTRHS
jgi:hypothetical protein